jgi:hypothetical protein
MDQTRYYPGTFDIGQLASQLTYQLQIRGYQTQSFGSSNQVVVQVRKGGEAAKVFGAQAALTAMLTQHPTGLLVTLGQQRWGDKAIAAGVGAIILWPLAISAAVGAARQSNLPNEVLSLLDMLVLQQNASAYPAPVPAQLMMQVQGMYQPPPPQYQVPPPPPPPYPPSAPAGPPVAPPRLCPSCHRPNGPDAAFCQYCATPLAGPPADHMPAPPPPSHLPSMRAPALPLDPTERVGTVAEATERGPAPGGPIGALALPSGRRLLLTMQEAIVGRGNPDGSQFVEVDLTEEPERKSVSRRHARIVRSGSSFELEDLNSANQTRLNGEPLVPGRRYPLHNGDVIEFGRVRCTFSL